MEHKEIHEKILRLLKDKGPSLPIAISKSLGINSLFGSAFLSELCNEKKIRVSNLRVGGTPLYLLEGQEELLEPFTKYLHPKENEAFILLKKSRILKDQEQGPAIRVALRAIKDFAIGFKKDGEVYWRYLSVSEDEVRNLLNEPIKTPELKEDLQKKEKEKIAQEGLSSQLETPKIQKEELQKSESLQEPVIKIKKEPKKPQKTKQKVPKNQEKLQEQEFPNPLAVKEPVKKEKPKSNFVIKTIDFLNKKFKIIQENSHKPKEYSCLTQINTDLGPITFLTIVKDKKSVSDIDLKKLLSESQAIPLPALFVHTGKTSKKAQEYANKYNSILKILKLE